MNSSLCKKKLPKNAPKKSPIYLRGVPLPKRVKGKERRGGRERKKEKGREGGGRKEGKGSREGRKGGKKGKGIKDRTNLREFALWILPSSLLSRVFPGSERMPFAPFAGAPPGLRRGSAGQGSALSVDEILADF